MGEDISGDIRSTIGAEGTSALSAVRNIILIVGAGVLLVGGYIYFTQIRGQDRGPHYDTETVERGDLTVTVSAVGELAPRNQVDVGTEVSGAIKEIFVDNNDRVTAGQLLARLDTEQLDAQVRRANAALLSSQARVGEAQANFADAGRTRTRTRELHQRGVATQDALDTAESAYDRAEASLASARAQVEVAQADLAAAQTSLSKAEIYSPVDGIVLDRKVDVGQTVVASMTTPVLFTLAEDLTEMELKVAVDEADVGQVAAGQQAVFTVDAYPNRRFPAETTRVRYAASQDQGVVTYETLLRVENPDLALRPGMTASATITVATVKDALIVPNAALRFRPSFAANEEQNQADETAEDDGAVPGDGWVLRDGTPERTPLHLGATNGRLTVVTDTELAEGDDVIIDEEEGR